MPLISLVGLPGSGKSTIGRRLAKLMSLPFVDADREFEAKHASSIAEFFERKGEASFRVEEAVLLESLTQPHACVLATGGGAVLSESSRASLRERTLCIYLHVSPASIANRISPDGHRPLFRSADVGHKLASLYDQRDGLYRAAAHEVFEIDRCPANESAKRIAALVVNREHTSRQHQAS